MMRFQKLTFTNAAGQTLVGRLDWPLDGRPKAFALFAHCFTCTKNLRAVKHLSEALSHQGIAVLRFDFTGLGESEGDFADTNFSANVDDLVRAAEVLRERHQAPQLLVGHSLGGAAVLKAAARIPECRAVATIGAPASPAHVQHQFQSSVEEIAARGEAKVLLAGRPFTLKKQFLDDLERHPLTEELASLKRALLIFHSPVDDVVGVDNAAQLFTAARHPKSFISLDRADHLLSREEDARYVGSALAAWAQRYLELPPPPNPQDLAGAQVMTRTEDGYRTEVRTPNHTVIVDEPAVLGGTDLGPTPYDYLLASLGSCTGITIRMYADRKGIPLEAVQVRLSHRRIHATDCEECHSSEGKVDIIDRELEFIGPELSDEHRQKLREIADKCPVHKSLESETKVRTTVRAAG